MDITQYKSLFHYGEPYFLACCCQKEVSKLGPKADFICPLTHAPTKAIGPTFGIIRAKTLQNTVAELKYHTILIFNSVFANLIKIYWILEYLHKTSFEALICG